MRAQENRKDGDLCGYMALTFLCFYAILLEDITFIFTLGLSVALTSLQQWREMQGDDIIILTRLFFGSLCWLFLLVFGRLPWSQLLVVFHRRSLNIYIANTIRRLRVRWIKVDSLGGRWVLLCFSPSPSLVSHVYEVNPIRYNVLLFNFIRILSFIPLGRETSTSPWTKQSL